MGVCSNPDTVNIALRARPEPPVRSVAKILRNAITALSFDAATVAVRSRSLGRQAMFDLVRLGWPNTVVVLAFAMLPVFAIAFEPADHAKVAGRSADTFGVAVIDMPPAID